MKKLISIALFWAVMASLNSLMFFTRKEFLNIGGEHYWFSVAIGSFMLISIFASSMAKHFSVAKLIKSALFGAMLVPAFAVATVMIVSNSNLAAYSDLFAYLLANVSILLIGAFSLKAKSKEDKQEDPVAEVLDPVLPEEKAKPIV